MMDSIVLVFFATLANAADWIEMEVFGKEHETFLRKYLELQIESLPMTPFKEFLRWCHQNLWKVFRNSGMKC